MRALTCLLLLALAPLTADAEPLETDEELVIQASTRPRLEARLGNHFGLEPEQLRYTGNGAGSSDLFTQRTRIGLSYTKARLRAKTTIQFSQVWGAENSTELVPFPVRPYEAWLEFSFFPKLELRAGRFEINYAEGRLFAAPNWSQVGRTWDGLRLRTVLVGEGFLDVFVARNQDGGPQTSILENDAYFGGIYTHFRSVPGVSELDLYVVGDARLSKLGGDLPHRRVLGLAGARLKLKSGGFDSVLEGAYQTATRCVPGEEGVCSSETEDFDGGMGELTFGYQTGEWRGFGGISYATQEFDPLYPSAHAHLGWLDLFRRTNIAEAHAGVTWRPDNWTVSLKAHEFWRTGNLKERIGTEVATLGRVALIKGLSAEGGAGVFFPDSGVATEGDPSGVATWFYTMMTWSY